MNQAQRKFLIDKIEESTKAQVDAIKSAKPEAPNLSNYLFHAVMSGNFEIISNEKIKEIIKRKALNSKQGNSVWMSNDTWSSSDNKISFIPEEFFIVPEQYSILRKEYDDKVREINNRIAEIQAQANSLIIRIQLASDKTLQTMINEVDDMGNISLMDSKLKLLTGRSDV